MLILVHVTFLKYKTYFNSDFTDKMMENHGKSIHLIF